MKTLTHLSISLIMAVWMGMVAVFSIQNIEAISLKFFTFETIRLPVGVLLSFCLGFGLLLGAIAPLLLPSSPSTKRRRYDRDDEDSRGLDF
jgi:lipopolysaccharide assembly protein A